MVNKHLLEDLVEMELWDNNMKEEIMRANGSIQHIEKIPQDIKELYKTSKSSNKIVVLLNESI